MSDLIRVRLKDKQISLVRRAVELSNTNEKTDEASIVLEFQVDQAKYDINNVLEVDGFWVTLVRELKEAPNAKSDN